MWQWWIIGNQYGHQHQKYIIYIYTCKYDTYDITAKFQLRPRGFDSASSKPKTSSQPINTGNGNEAAKTRNSLSQEQEHERQDRNFESKYGVLPTASSIKMCNRLFRLSVIAKAINCVNVPHSEMELPGITVLDLPVFLQYSVVHLCHSHIPTLYRAHHGHKSWTCRWNVDAIWGTSVYGGNIATSGYR